MDNSCVFYGPEGQKGVVWRHSVNKRDTVNEYFVFLLALALGLGIILGIAVAVYRGGLALRFAWIMAATTFVVALISFTMGREGLTPWVLGGGFVIGTTTVFGLVALAFRQVIHPIRRLAANIDWLTEGAGTTAELDRLPDELGLIIRAFQAYAAHIQRLAEGARAIGQGDLTAGVAARSQTDVLALALAEMVARLRALVRGLTTQTHEIAREVAVIVPAARQTGAAIDTIAHRMRDVAVGAADQADQLTQAESTVQQVVIAIDGIAAGAQEQAAAVSRASALTAALHAGLEQTVAQAEIGADRTSQASQLAQTGQVAVRGSVDSLDRIHAATESARAHVHRMDARSNEIGTILVTIQEIASQTNLLALNAAIEAARAGDHGVGFAVVADEVRKLSERAASATQEIGQLVNDMRRTVSEAVIAINAGMTEVQQGVAQVGSADRVLTEIVSVAQQASSEISAVSAATREMRSAAHGLTEMMESVSAVVEENTASAEEMSAAASEVLAAIERVTRISAAHSQVASEVEARAVDSDQDMARLIAATDALDDAAREAAVGVQRLRIPVAEPAEAEIRVPSAPTVAMLPATV